MRVCITCGKNIEGSHWRRKYCSVNCRSKARNKTEYAVHTCLHCGAEFYGWEQEKYCSKRCKWKHKGNKHNNICVECGTSFTGYKGIKYCSVECRSKNKRPRKKYQSQKSTIVCSICGNKFIGGKNAKTCSKKCQKEYVKLYHRKKSKERMRIKRLSYTEEDKLKEYNRLLAWRSKHPERIKELKRERDRIRNNMKERGEVGVKNKLTPKSWMVTLEHFGNACAYCGSTEKPLERDHFVPFRYGGRLTVDNTVPACKKCNGDKNSTMPLDWLSTKENGELIYERIVEYLSKMV